jgi:biopolymer transport protein ExbD
MGMSTGSSREINVTPLIDVLLVLLIIFLVMMPIMVRMETVALPPNTGDDPVNVPIALKLDADLSVTIDDGPQFPRRELPSQLRAKLGGAKAVFVDFVDGVPWGEVVATVDTVRGVANETQRRELEVAVRLRGP